MHCDRSLAASLMSAAASHNGGSALASQNRAQRRPRDEQADEQQRPAQSAAHMSPAMRVYRHALESIFAMLQLPELSRVLALTSLELRLSGQHTAATVDGVLTTLAALGSLRQLVFRVNSAVGVDFSVLAASSSLRDLTLQDRHANWRLELSDEQVKQIRTSLGHLQRISLADMTSDELTRFLEPPVTARWQDIGHVLASLLPCCGLTDLYLHCAINTAQLGTLLAKLTQLKKLTFLGQLESLQCFSSCPIMHTLEELTLHGRFPLSELVHLYTLRRLHSLTFRQAFESLDSATFASLSPPTPAFPLLTLFLQSWGRPYQTPVELERKGLSFEWMQKRLTQ